MKAEKIFVFACLSVIIPTFILIGYNDIKNSHTTLGTYGLFIEEMCGKNTIGSIAVWYEDYLHVERGFLIDGALIGFGIGLAAGAIPTLIVYYRKDKKKGEDNEKKL